MNTESFTLQAFIFPTTPDKGRQGLITKWDEKNAAGFGMFIDEQGHLSCKIGNGTGKIAEISSKKPLLRKVWYLAAVTFDSKTGKIKIFQEPVVTPTNGGLGMSMLYPLDSTANVTSGSVTIKPGINKAPLLIAASTKNIKSGRHICGGHYKEALEPFPSPNNMKFIMEK